MDPEQETQPTDVQQKKLKLSDADDDLQNGSASTSAASKSNENDDGAKSDAENDNDETTPTKITDLNQFCLEKIFMQLDVESLFSVATANKWLEHSAASVYGRRFSKSPVNLCSKRTCEQSVYMFGEYICVDSLKLSLAFLRCFGAHIPEIILFCRRAFAGTDDEWISRYLNEHCANTLQTIHVTESSTFANETFTRPFANLASADFFGRNFAHGFCNLVKWFPALQHLRLSCLIDYSAIAEKLPHLEHLTIPVADAGWDKVAELLRLNPQLNSLEMDLAKDVKKSATDLLGLINENTAISKLTVNADGDSYVTVSTEEVERFVSEHAGMVELILRKHVFATDDVIALIGRLNQLKKFKFRVNERSGYDALVNRLGDEWEHRIGFVFNTITKNSHCSVELNRKE